VCVGANAEIFGWLKRMRNAFIWGRGKGKGEGCGIEQGVLEPEKEREGDGRGREMIELRG
jgi:hypothetical protein